MKEYLPRIAYKLLKERLDAKGAVLIEGPKWCGKTTTAKKLAKSVLALDQPDMTKQYQAIAELSSSQLLEGDTPRLIDEWQIAPNLWNTVKKLELSLHLMRAAKSESAWILKCAVDKKASCAVFRLDKNDFPLYFWSKKPDMQCFCMIFPI